MFFFFKFRSIFDTILNHAVLRRTASNVTRDWFGSIHVQRRPEVLEYLPFVSRLSFMTMEFLSTCCNFCDYRLVRAFFNQKENYAISILGFFFLHLRTEEIRMWEVTGQIECFTYHLYLS